MRSASVAAKSGAASSCPAAYRSSRRCNAIGSAVKEGKVEGDAVGGRGGPASAANGSAAKNHLLSHTGNFGLPPGFFIAGKLRHLCEMIAELRVPGSELRQQFVADPIARKGQMPVGGVFAPRLIARIEKGFDFGASAMKQRANDDALGKLQNRVNSR